MEIELEVLTQGKIPQVSAITTHDQEELQDKIRQLEDEVLKLRQDIQQTCEIHHQELTAAVDKVEAEQQK